MTTKVYFENKNVLVLGGAGFIGSYLCEQLVKNGDQVICVDNFVSSDVENIRSLLEYPNFEFIKHDITEDIDYETLPGLRKFKVDGQGIQEIYNLACPTAPKDFTKFPIKTAMANSIGVIKSLETAKQYKARYLLASTSAVYGEPPKDGSAIKENYYGLLDYLGPRACYNEGKRFAETLVMTYRDTYQLNTSIARIFGTYGPRMLQHSGRQIPDFIRSAVDNQDIAIAGNDKTASTFCYVKDIIEGMISLMASEISDPLNLGSPHANTYTEMANIIIALTKSTSKVTYEEGLKFASQRPTPDIGKAKEEINWLPLVSNEDGLKQAIDYFKATAILHGPRLLDQDE
jgi:UDP-glucuronate decarboxylase